MPKTLEELRQQIAEQEANELAARRRWEALDLARTKKDIQEMDFPDEWLEEAKSEAAK